VVHGLARVTAAATLVLIVAGSLVTTTGAGLAVPDWPTTFGHSMFTFPWSGMVGGVLVEHGHRLLGSAVGVLTVALALALWRADRRPALAGLGAAAVVLVSVQGVLGGLRVVWLADVLAVVHACLAHVFFAVLAVVVAVTGARWAAAAKAEPGPAPRRLAAGAAGVAALVLGQIALGALTAHGTHPGWVGLHLAGAAVVVLAVGGLASSVARQGGLAPAGRRLHVLLALQLALGAGAYVARFTGLAVPGGEAAALGLAVAHRAVGALLFAGTVTLALAAATRAGLAPALRAGRDGRARPAAAVREVPA
jgi:cytochrome c oxidase assembly protein subunit 15